MSQLNPDHPLAPKDHQEARARLLRLATHLEDQNARHHRRFYFSIIAELDTEDPEKAKSLSCGTVGCAAGELPYCFPEIFRFDLENLKCYNAGFIATVDPANTDRLFDNHTSLSDDLVTAGTFFGLDEEQTAHLFVPWEQDAEEYGGELLDVKATPLQVARNIRVFCEQVDIMPEPEQQTP